MTNVIFNNRENDRQEWMIATKGNKYITLEISTCIEGNHDYTITYNVADEAELLATLNDPMCNADAIVEFGWGPKPVKVVKHDAAH